MKRYLVIESFSIQTRDISKALLFLLVGKGIGYL